MEQVELSFVVPAYNEERCIENVLGTLDAVIAGKNLPYEIIVVDDGSSDETSSESKEVRQKKRSRQSDDLRQECGKRICGEDRVHKYQWEHSDFCRQRHGN